MASVCEAGASGLPSAVIRGYLGSDLPKYDPRIKRIQCPFTEEELAAVPSTRPDVTVIHAQQADRLGNVMIWGIVGVQKEAVLASKKSIVTVEEIVDGFETQSNAEIHHGSFQEAVAGRPFSKRPSLDV